MVNLWPIKRTIFHKFQWIHIPLCCPANRVSSIYKKTISLLQILCCIQSKFARYRDNDDDDDTITVLKCERTSLSAPAVDAKHIACRYTLAMRDKRVSHVMFLAAFVYCLHYITINIKTTLRSTIHRI